LKALPVKKRRGKKIVPVLAFKDGAHLGQKLPVGADGDPTAHGGGLQMGRLPLIYPDALIRHSLAEHHPVPQKILRVAVHIKGQLPADDVQHPLFIKRHIRAPFYPLRKPLG
jgi:hypothetical protein